VWGVVPCAERSLHQVWARSHHQEVRQENGGKLKLENRELAEFCVTLQEISDKMVGLYNGLPPDLRFGTLGSALMGAITRVEEVFGQAMER